MDTNWTEKSLLSLIDEQVEENLHLDYKASGSLSKTDGKKKEISKDISAMANSDGGSIIYGIKEFDENSKRHLPENIDPINREEISKEWLEQVINSNIHPKISGLYIEPIPIGSEKSIVVYRVVIPKSNTVHQANDKRYYKRFNFESVPMEDYEIKDIMNRNQHPLIELNFEIYVEEKIPSSDPLSLNFKSSEKNKKQKSNYLYIYAHNNGLVYANYINCFLYIPKSIIHPFLSTQQKNVKIEDGEYLEYQFNNTKRDIVDYEGTGFTRTPRYGQSRYDPILPKLSRRIETVWLINDFTINDEVIIWNVYADNASPKTGTIKLDSVPIINVIE